MTNHFLIKTFQTLLPFFLLMEMYHFQNDTEVSSTNTTANNSTSPRNETVAVQDQNKTVAAQDQNETVTVQEEHLPNATARPRKNVTVVDLSTVPNRNFHALFMAKRGNRVICSGVLLAPRWIISTIMPLQAFGLNKIYVLFGPPFYPTNITSRSRVYIVERRSMLVKSPRIVLLKTQMDVYSNNERTFINLQNFYQQRKTCSVMVWRYPSENSMITFNKPLQSPLHHKKLIIEKFEKNGSLNCDNQFFGCISFLKQMMMSPVNYGAPVMCNVGLIGIFCGTPNIKPIKVPLRSFAIIAFDNVEKQWIAKTISQPDGPRVSPCNRAIINQSTFYHVFTTIIIISIVI